MNLSKTMKVAALLAVGSTSLVQAAATPLHITGSTAFRAATMNAVANLMTNPFASYATASGAAKAITSADYATFSGLINGTQYNIFMSWSGSEQGIASVAQTTTPLPTLQFLTVAGNAQTVVTKAVAPATCTGGNQVGLSSGGPAAVFESDVADVCMSDGWQKSTPFNGTVSGTTYAALIGTTLPGLTNSSIVGVVPFKFVANSADTTTIPATSYLPASYSGNLTTTAGSTAATLDSAITALKPGASITGNANLTIDTSVSAVSGTSVTLSIPAKTTGASVPSTFDYTGISNITDILAKKTFESAGGSVANLAQFSGSSADSGVSMIAVGRNHDSGTRNALVLCTGIDKAGTSATAIQQYYPLDINGNVIGTSGAGTSIEDKELVPAETINGFNYTVGQSGYSSGSGVAAVFTATNDLPNTLFISYLGINDAKTALTGNATELSYNGFYYSPTAVQQGQYTFWTFEHLYYQSTLKFSSKTVANEIATQLGTGANPDALCSGLVFTPSTFPASRIPNTQDGAIVTR